MDDNLNQYDLMLEAYAELAPEIEQARLSKPTVGQPALSDAIARLGYLPVEALFLGIASDELPVLLNLLDPLPGPLLIVGDQGTGKTSLLRTIAHAAERMHQPQDLQFGVVTNRPDEWSVIESSPNNVGVFPMTHNSAEDFILSLATWAHGNKSSRQSILLLLDDLEAVTRMNFDAIQNLRWLLLRGPSRRVWPIITLDTKHLRNMEEWISSFRTRILGNIRSVDAVRILNAEKAQLASLLPGSEFTLSEGNHWLRFWLPALD